MSKRRSEQSISVTVILLSTTAGRRIQTRRTSRQRRVFSYRPPCLLQVDEGDELAVPRSAVAARLVRWRTHEPFSPVGAAAVRPMADAANTLIILREILRGPR